MVSECLALFTSRDSRLDEISLEMKLIYTLPVPEFGTTWQAVDWIEENKGKEQVTDDDEVRQSQFVLLCDE